METINLNDTCGACGQGITSALGLCFKCLAPQRAEDVELDRALAGITRTSDMPSIEGDLHPDVAKRLAFTQMITSGYDVRWTKKTGIWCATTKANDFTNPSTVEMPDHSNLMGPMICINCRSYVGGYDFGRVNAYLESLFKKGFNVTRLSTGLRAITQDVSVLQ